MQTTKTPTEPQTSVAVPTRGGDGLLAVAVRDGVASLSDAVLLRGSARRLYEELGDDLTPERVTSELERLGAADEAAGDAQRFLGQLARGGLVPATEVVEAGGPQELPPAAVELEADDLERLARAILARRRVLRYRALGRSMRPAVPHGSLLEVVARPFGEVGLGEVVLYSAAEGARLVAHRVIARRGENRLVTRGDSSSRVDEIGPEEFLGVVRCRIDPTGRRVAVSDGVRRWVGWTTGVLHRLLAGIVRALVVRPLRSTFGRRSLVRSFLRIVLRGTSGILLRLERAARSLRRPLDVGRAALLTTEEKDADRKGLYARRAIQRFTSLDENMQAGLTPIEELVLARHPLPPGKVLVLGCGPGREVLAFARRGYAVTGLDREEGMLTRARSFAAEQGLDARFVAGDALDFRVGGGPFDGVVVFSGLVNMVLPRGRRVGLLSAAHDHLRPGGRVLVTFLSAYVVPGQAPPPRAGGFWSAVNAEHEAGDRYLLNEAVHVFGSADELCDEAREAGLEVEAVHRDQRAYDRAEGQVRGYAVFRRPS